jgi:glycosyltransferase involved in cell wall biosynthesis
MRVLVIHNRYSSRVPSGENLSVDDEVRWLREAGIEVHLHTATNDDAFGADLRDRARQAASATWSLPARRLVEKVIDQVAPDLVHVHNLFPLLTASVPWTAVRRGLPVVWTARNQRVTCVDGTHFRNGQPCHLCRPGWRVPGVRYGCYRESVAASALVTSATSVFRGIARRRLTALAISHSMRRWLVDGAGFAADRVHVKYNGIAGPPVDRPIPPAAGRRTFLFAGKLAPYKGVSLLLDAWRRTPDLDAELRVVGDGPVADEVQRAAADDPRIIWVGQVAAHDMVEHFAAARVVLVPSIWEEPFGRIAAEALAYGRPVITSGLGGLSEIVDERSGWVVGTDPEALAAAIISAADADDLVEAKAEAARTHHARLFSPEATTEALIRFYEDALANRRGDPASTRG